MRHWTVVAVTSAALIGGLTIVPAQAAGTLSCPVPVTDAVAATVRDAATE